MVKVRNQFSMMGEIPKSRQEVANKLSERQDKYDEAMAAFGPLLNIVALKVEDLLKKFKDSMPSKPKL